MRESIESRKWRVSSGVKEDTLVAIFLLLTVLACKANTITLPYYWDEMSAYIQPAHWLADGSLLRAFPGFHPPETFYGHPFGVYLTLAALYKIFGASITVSHLFILTISFIGLYYTYLIGKHLHNCTAGIIASLLLLLSPLFFAQSGMVNGDTVITSLGAVTTYYFLKKEYRLFLLSSTLLVLSKESSAAFIAAMILYGFFSEEEGRSWNRVLIYAAPLFLLLGFFILQKVAAGSFLPNKYFKAHDFFDFQNFLEKLQLVSNWAFLLQYKAILLVLIALDLVLNFKKSFRKEYILFILISALFAGAFTLIFFLPRYIMPILPYFFIVGAASMVNLFGYRKIYLGVTAAVLALFVSIVHGRGDSYGSSEADMQYRDIVLSQKAACEYVESAFPGKTVLANFPFKASLTSPHLGYVKTPVKMTFSPTEHFEVMLYSRQSDESSAKVLLALVDSENLVLAKRFDLNGKAVEVYIKDEDSL